ncbi:uracil-DNA glycosylase [Thalassotalea piscium]
MKLPPIWQSLIEQEQAKPYYAKLQAEINQQRLAGETIFPEENQVFAAFNYCDLPDVKVVILGQDPYHGTGPNEQPQAHGLSFSVPPGVKTPPSLVNIYKELSQDINYFSTPTNGCLTAWAKQGVLLLNTVLTVKKGEANSHAKLGWETFTDAIIDAINQHNKGCVFMLWGSHAQKKGKHIDVDKHYVLNAPHPSPLSAYRGFFGCQHFSKANYWLEQHQGKAIKW